MGKLEAYLKKKENEKVDVYNLFMLHVLDEFGETGDLWFRLNIPIIKDNFERKTGLITSTSTIKRYLESLCNSGIISMRTIEGAQRMREVRVLFKEGENNDEKN